MFTWFAKKKMLSVTQKQLVAAIDLGTEDSGYGYSLFSDYKRDPTNVKIRQWCSGCLISVKQPTCVLCNSAGEFDSFGYDAENKYSALSADNEHYNWYFFPKFINMLSEKQAGIDGANLTIALEPDAAAVYCEALPSDRLSCRGRFNDEKYMVIDLGDSTSVFTVHEKQPNGTIKDVHKVSSRPWGSTKVNEEFIQMIIKILGNQTFQTFRSQYREDHVEMLRDVEIKYRKIDTNDNRTIVIRTPTALEETYQEFTGKTVQDAIEQSPYKGKIQWRRQKMMLDAELVRSFFKNYISNIINHIENLCQEPGVKGTSAFLIIGKLAECRLVQDAVLKSFPKIKVVVTNEPEVAVIKGAVVLGHKFGLTCGYNLRLQQPMNKNHSAVAPTTAKRDEDDVYSDDNANGSTSSNSYEQDFRKDQTKNLKYKSLSEEGEDTLSSDVLEMTVQTQDKSTQGHTSKRDEDNVYSDDNANGSTSSNSYEQDFRNDQTKNLKYKSLSEEGEDALSSDLLEMTVQTQDKSTQGLETQLKNQMTLEANNTRAPSDDELFTLSRQLSKFDNEWWFLAKLLGLSDKQIDEIERGEGSKHIVRQYYRMLIAWKRHNAGQENGSVRYLLRQCDEADIDRKVTDNIFVN